MQSPAKRSRTEVQSDALIMVICRHVDGDATVSQIVQAVSGVSDFKQLKNTMQTIVTLTEPFLEEHEMAMTAACFPLRDSPSVVWQCVQDFSAVVAPLCDTPKPASTLENTDVIKFSQLLAVQTALEEGQSAHRVLQRDPMLCVWLAHDIDELEEDSELDSESESEPESEFEVETTDESESESESE